jgi:biopolymer transport protein ExbD
MIDLIDLKRLKTKPNGLNLVAMMDIFTVLVFFLIFNVQDESSFTTSGINLPVSTMAEDTLKETLIPNTLELPNREHAILDKKEYQISSSSDLLSKALSDKCTSDSGCDVLLIKAPNNMDYVFVDQFVQLGREVGFNKIYLLVLQQ